MIAHRPPGPPRRRGFGLVELAIAGALFTTMLFITTQVVSRITAERQLATRREFATRLVGNVMERALARPWGSITTADLAPLAASFGAANPRVNGLLRIEVIAGPGVDGLEQKRVIVTVEWPDRSLVAESPVRLVAWISARKAAQP